MSYKELKEETNEHKPSNVVYAEILGAIMMTSIICGTLLMTTSMWIQERHSEIGYLRGSNP